MSVCAEWQGDLRLLDWLLFSKISMEEMSRVYHDVHRTMKRAKMWTLFFGLVLVPATTYTDNWRVL